MTLICIIRKFIAINNYPITEIYAVCAEADSDDKWDLNLPEELNNISKEVTEVNSDTRILLVICCSSTGAGELPENARQFCTDIAGKNLREGSKRN